jgi:large subunit ribosomal protein L25
MAIAELKGELRESGNKSAARKLRREAFLPGVLYGLKDNVILKVNQKEFSKLMDQHGHNVLIGLTLAGDSVPKRQVILKDHQAHPLQKDWLHVDFLEIDMNKKTRVPVPVKLIGHSPAEKMGGLINHATKELEVECLPGDIPDAIEVEMVNIELGEVIHVKDLKVSDKIEIMGDPGVTVVGIYVEKVKEEKTDEDEEAAEGDAAKSPAETDTKSSDSK